MNVHSSKTLQESDLVDAIRLSSYSLNNPADLKPLYNRIGDAQIVMLGEASHGTHEYYTWRALISKKLIEEMGFNFIAVEGDWPDCYRLNRFIKGYEPEDTSAFDVLQKFNRWPTWMWANWEISALAEWMFQHNKGLASNQKVGFYGLDVYSLWESMESIMGYLKQKDPAALKIAEKAFQCFEPYRKDEGRSYGWAGRLVPELCQDEVIGMLREIQNKLPVYNMDHENVFSAEQNAFVAVHAEKYYRAMVKGGPESWNIRDRHMAGTLNRLLALHGPKAKAIVWAHNTHIGDARATNMASDGMYNIGQLGRLHKGKENVVLVGFGSNDGTVIAGDYWGAPMQTMPVPAAQKGSWEQLFHLSGHDNKLLIMNDIDENEAYMKTPRGHRAIGVVYHPAHESRGNYVPTLLSRRYDAFIYLNKTKALHPLHVQPDGQKTPETYPFGV
ncbi:Erythromycin esterase homolog [Daejeonella rubra]|uniref:Erythromycin esterase homolog n=1 Tax=Daejeonella rubra TaxID=990371 RepID=A0A1G9LNS3_9SPHI|nr:erythromycin esterase family protein [Daejeonella rubra]SDL63504.1 Erythromycin esterase homolog [Daejeonella rubra]